MEFIRDLMKGNKIIIVGIFVILITLFDNREVFIPNNIKYCIGLILVLIGIYLKTKKINPKQ